MRFIRLVFLFIAVITAGCAGSEAPQTALQNNLNAQLNAFYAAVVSRNVNEVYSMLADSYKLQFDKEKFTALFEQNYEIFLEYASSIREDSNSFSLYAQAQGDPCATVMLGFDSNGDWRIAQTQDVFVSEEMHKTHLISLVKSLQFTSALQEYARKHPELSGFEQRSILRTIAAGDIQPQHVQFTGNQAVIMIPDEIQIFMTCTGKVWRLDQCNLLR